MAHKLNIPAAAKVRIQRSSNGLDDARGVEEPITQTGLSKICDNRLRAIRVWLWLGKDPSGRPVSDLLSDLQRSITKALAQGGIDRAWGHTLSDMVQELDFERPLSLQPIYEHIGLPYPMKVLGKPSASWSRDIGRD